MIESHEELRKVMKEQVVWKIVDFEFWNFEGTFHEELEEGIHAVERKSRPLGLGFASGLNAYFLRFPCYWNPPAATGA